MLYWERMDSALNQSNGLLPRPHIPSTLAIALLGIGVGIVVGVTIAAASPLYTVAGIIALGGLIFLFADVLNGLLAFIGVATLLPFAVIPVSIGPVRLTMVDVCLTVTLLIVLLRPLADRRERFRSTGVDLPVFLFISVAVAAFILGTAYQTTSSDARLFLKLLNSVFVFFTVVNAVRDQKTLERLLVYLFAGGVGAGVLGIALYFIPQARATQLLAALGPFGYPRTNILQFIASTTTQRAIGTSIDPNILGATLMMCGCIGVGLFFLPRPRPYKLAVIGGLAIILAGLLLTYSRGSLFGFIAGGAVVATFRYRRLWLLAALLAVAIPLVPELAQSAFVSHIQSGLLVQDKAAAMRLGEYKDAFRLIQQYPWFGVGFGQAPDVNLYVGVSSIYLLLAEQVGLIGLVIWLWAMGTIVYRGLRRCAVAQDDASTLAVGCLAALVSALVGGIFDHHFVDMNFPHVVGMVWLIAGLQLVGLNLSRAADSPKEMTELLTTKISALPRQSTSPVR